MNAPTLPYQVFDPSGCAFPSPRVSLLPVLGRAALGRVHGAVYRQVGAGRPQRRYVRGRYALHAAYRLCGVGPEGRVLAPAYHCRTMIDPAISLGGAPELYPLDERLAPDLTALRRLLARPGHPVRALLLTHFFGLPQDASAVKALCDQHGVALIEDCSHALLEHVGAERLGRHGRYVTASPYKFYPCEEGGLLIGQPGETLAPLQPAGLRATLRTFAHAFEHVRGRDARTAPALDTLDEDLARLHAAGSDCGRDERRELPGTSMHYDVREEGLAASSSSHLLARLCDTDRLAERRRANYRRWLDAVCGLPQCRPLYDTLPDDAVPYMFPLLIEQPGTHFFLLKRLGVPIWRWDDIADSACPVARHYRQHLLHLPCHQTLSDAQLGWMTAAVARVMRAGAAPAATSNRTTDENP
jgi:dTDP-4-amino-4,6-dideoxygalactose transaminase